MTEAVTRQQTQDIIVDEVFPHTAQAIWKTLTTGDLIARWLMKPSGFEAVKGNRFTYQTTPAGAWDGVIQCEVLEAVPNERLVYSWRGGDKSNVGYGSPLDTVVTWVLTRHDGGTRVRLIHSGFLLPVNETAFAKMSEGWRKVVPNVSAITSEQD